MNAVVIEVLKGLPRMLHNLFVLCGRTVGEALKNGIKHFDWGKYLAAAGIDGIILWK